MANPTADFETHVLVGQFSGNVSWFPDGSQILFHLAVSQPYSWRPYWQALYLVNADGSALRVLGEGLPYGVLSPGGSRIAAALPDESDVVLYTAALDGSDVVLYTAALDGSDARVLVRKGESGLLEAVGPQQQGDGPIDIIPCFTESGGCLQVLDGRLVTEPCSTGYVVPDPEANAGLVRDCEVLWEIGREGLRNWAIYLEQSTWNGQTPISEWEGVVVGETSNGLRVVQLSLEGWNLRGLISGRLATELAKLTALESVELSDNRLRGCIPEGLRGKVIGYEEPEVCGE